MSDGYRGDDIVGYKKSIRHPGGIPADAGNSETDVPDSK